MPNSKELFNELVDKIKLDESSNEIQSIVYILLEDQLGLSRSDILAKKEVFVEEEDRMMLDEFVRRVNRDEPIQYLLEEAWFYGARFMVDLSVLIPRPETELLIDQVLQFHPNRKQPLTIVDIGTGSGCIAITLSRELPNATLHATDISVAALMTAAENAKRNAREIEFLRHNILTEEFSVTGIDWLVSNPPYVTRSEKAAMRKRVTDYEPPEALFVRDDDPLLFYSALARTGRKILNPTGKVAVEINERFGKEVKDLFLKEGYQSVSVVKDLYGKDRVVLAHLY